MLDYNVTEFYDNYYCPTSLIPFTPPKREYDVHNS